MLATEAVGYPIAKEKGGTRTLPSAACLSSPLTMKYEPKLPRIPCGNPDCPTTIPETWTFCKGRKCQGARTWWNPDPAMQAALTRQSEMRAATYRRAYEYNKVYLRAYRRLRRRAHLVQRTKTERQVFLENSRLRRELLEEALTMATPELRLLIEEQLADPKDRIKRMKGEPWGMASLNAPLPGTDNLTLADLLASDDVVARF